MILKNILPLLLILGIISLSIFIAKNVTVREGTSGTHPIPIVYATPFNPFPYKVPVLPQKRSYLTYLVGDSIVESLGLNAEILRQDLIGLYPTHEFVNYNYGFGSTNILSLEERLTRETTYQGTKFPAILDQGFDLIIIESFAYNPLSELGPEGGLTKYLETLDSDIKLIIKARPDSVVALMTPIAPNRENFAKFNRDLSQEVRTQWVNERTSYITKEIEYAKKNNIPLINVYEKSQTADGDGDLKYINPNDFIHPSKEGIKLISKTIADFIYQNSIFPR